MMRTRFFSALGAMMAFMLLTASGCGASVSTTKGSTTASTRVVLSMPTDEDGTNGSSNSWSALASTLTDALTGKKSTVGTAVQVTLSQTRSLHEQAQYVRSLARSASSMTSQKAASNGSSDHQSVPHLKSKDLLVFSPAVRWAASSLFSPLVGTTSVSSSPACPVSATEADSSSSDTSNSGTSSSADSDSSSSSGSSNSSTGTDTTDSGGGDGASADSSDSDDNDETAAQVRKARQKAALDATHDNSCRQITNDVTTISTALASLKSRHVRVVFLGTGIGTTAPDAAVRTASAYQIGQSAAANLVQKIRLSDATKQNPRAILLLLPSDEDLQSRIGATGLKQTRQTLPTATYDYLRGVLDVLSPYFSSGVAYNAYDIHLTDADSHKWADLVVPTDADDASSRIQRIFDTCRKQILAASQSVADSQGPLGQDRLLGRLSHIVLGTGDAVPLAGVMTGNDALAKLTISELTARGYTGSASDINPQVTLGSILGTIGHSPDLIRGRVPDPASSSDGLSTASASAWPIVIGFGGSSQTAPSVADGQEWATGVVDQKRLSDTLVTVVRNCARGKSLLTGLTSMTARLTATSTKKTVPVTDYATVFVDDSTLKSVLVDDGYISAADAGI